MELIAIIGIVIALIFLYFCFGILLKFLIAWWIILAGTPILFVVAILFGWVGAIIAIGGFIFLLRLNNTWGGSEIYFKIERVIDKAFNLGDA